MYNNIVIENISILNEMAKEPQKGKNELLAGTGDISKIENAYKTLFRKYIDSPEAVNSGAPSKKSNITLIGPPKGVEVDDQKRAEIIYEEATNILRAYVKAIFRENPTHFSEISSRTASAKELVKTRVAIQKEIVGIVKKLKELDNDRFDIGTHADDYDYFSYIKQQKDKAEREEKRKENNTTYESEKLVLSRKGLSLESQLKNVEAKIDALQRENEGVRTVVGPQIDEYVLKVLSIPENESDWPNAYKQPPASNIANSALTLYHQAIQAHNFDQIKESFIAIMNNASPIFADFFALSELHLEGATDAAGKAKFPQIQIMNLLISAIIKKVDELARQSDLVKRMLVSQSASEAVNGLAETDITNEQGERLSRTIQSISDNEIITFRKLFAQNRYEAIGQAFTEAERVMFMTIDKNIKAINKFLAQNKTSILSLTQSFRNKIIKYGQTAPVNKYEKEYKDIGLEDAFEDQTSLILKKWKEVFAKIPPEVKPFAEIFDFIKLADSKFKVEENSTKETYKVTAEGMTSTFYNPVLFFLSLVNNDNVLKNDQINDENLVRSDWGQSFRDFMGAQKIPYSTSRQDLASLLEIGRFMREGFVRKDIANPESEIGKRLQQAAQITPQNIEAGTVKPGRGIPKEMEGQPGSAAGLNLVSGDKNVLINSREFLDKLKEELPDQYSSLIFTEFLRIKNEILQKKAAKEYEAATQLYNGPYQVAKENVIALLSPILREFIFERYSQDTQLWETTKLFNLVLKEFQKCIEKYNPAKDGDVEKFIWARLQQFNKTKYIQELQSGAKRMWYIPQSNEGILALMDSLLEVTEVREMHRKDSYHNVRELVYQPSPVEGDFKDQKMALLRRKYIKDRAEYEKELERSTKINGKYYVIDVSDKDTTYYTLEPKESLIRDPEQAYRLLASLWSRLNKVFWDKLKEFGLESKEAAKDQDVASFYFHKITNTLDDNKAYTPGYESTESPGHAPRGLQVTGDKEYKTLEPIASDDKDRQNQNRTITMDLSQKNQQLIEVLSIASVLFSILNIDENIFMNRISNNIFDMIDPSSNVKGRVKNIVSSLFRREWDDVHSLLFKPIGPEQSNEGPWINARQISDKEREGTKSSLLIVVSAIIATCIDLVKQGSKQFKEHLSKTDIAGLLRNLNVDSVYKGYTNVIDSLKELLSSAFLEKIGTVRPKRSIPKDRGSYESGEWNVIGLNDEGTASIRHPITLNKKWEKWGDLLGLNLKQNQDPTSDTRQQAMLAATNAIYRYMHRLQTSRGDVDTSDILRKLGNSIDSEIKSSFKNAWSSRNFASTSWKNRDLNRYHGKITKALENSIEQFGYKVDSPHWFLQNEALRNRAIDIVEKDIKEQFLKGIETKKELGGPKSGDYSGVSGPSNPLHTSGINPSSRNKAVSDTPETGNPKHDISSTEFDPSHKVDLPVSKGFAGNTAIDETPQNVKIMDAEKRLQQFIEVYPQFLEEKAAFNVSMFEPRTLDSTMTLEDTISDAAGQEDSKTLQIAVHEFDNVLDSCFSPIGQKTVKNEKGIPKFVYSYADLNENDTKLVNSYVTNLGQRIEDSPLESREFFKSQLALIPEKKTEEKEENHRNKAFKEILFMKYFEYIYTREILLSETIMYLMGIENERKSKNEPKFESIADYIQQSNLNIKHIPGVEFKFYPKDNLSKRMDLYTILKKIVGADASNYLELAHDLSSFIKGATDTDFGEVETHGQSKKSTARTDIHGMDASKQGKQEKSRVTSLDKQLFNRLNIQNISKIMSRVLTSKAPPDYEGNVSYDKIRQHIRNLIVAFNEPINTGSDIDVIKWLVSYVKDNIFRIRNFLYSSANAVSLSKLSPFERKELFSSIDNLLHSVSYDPEKLPLFRKALQKLLTSLYNTPVGEEEDYEGFDTTSPINRLKEIVPVVKKANSITNEEFTGEFAAKLSETLKNLFRYIKAETFNIDPKASEYLTSDGGLIKSIIPLLKVKAKKPLAPEVYYKVSNLLDQLMEYLNTLVKDNKAQPRYKDPYPSKVPEGEKAKTDQPARATPETAIKPKDQEVVKKLQGKKIKESKDFEPFKQAMSVDKILKCIKTESTGVQRVPYMDYSKANPGKLSRVLFELSRQHPVDLDNYRVFLTDENKSKVNIVFEYTDKNRGKQPEYIWIVPKRTVSSN